MAFFRRKAPRPAAAEPVTALIRNDAVAAALAEWGAQKNAQTLAGVLRQCVAGELLLDGTGSHLADGHAGLKPGDTLSIGWTTDTAGRRLLSAFTSQERLAAYHHGDPVFSFAQPAAATLAQAVHEEEGIALDPGSPDVCIAYAEEICANLTDDPAQNMAIKAMAQRPGSVPWPWALSAIAAAPTLYIGVKDVLDADGTVTGTEVANVEGTGERVAHAAFTCPAEVFAWQPGYAAWATTPARIAQAALDDGLAGMMLNPAGPSIFVPASDLPALVAG